MPLAHTPYRPVPEVELLARRYVSVEEAISGLEASVSSSTPGGSASDAVPGTSLVNFKQIPDILQCLRKDWVGLAPSDRPQCFVEVRGRLEMHMNPCFLGERMLEGMRGAAGFLLLHFDPTLQCVPIGFRQLKPAGSHAAVVGESPYVHYLIEFTAIGFAPKKGTTMVARPSEAQTAIGFNAKLLNKFNCFVRKGDLPKDAYFDGEEGQWMRGNGERLVNEQSPIWVQVGQHKSGEYKGTLDLDRGLGGGGAAAKASKTGKRKKSLSAAPEVAEAEVEAPAPKKRKSKGASDATNGVEVSPVAKKEAKSKDKGKEKEKEKEKEAKQKEKEKAKEKEKEKDKKKAGKAKDETPTPSKRNKK